MLAQSLNPSQVEKALLKAGKNRASLERVLKLYQNDKEKYAAACYLIANMPLHSQAGGLNGMILRSIRFLNKTIKLIIVSLRGQLAMSKNEILYTKLSSKPLMNLPRDWSN